MKVGCLKHQGFQRLYGITRDMKVISALRSLLLRKKADDSESTFSPARSKSPPPPSPPPMHIVTTPNFAFRRAISFASVPVIREPVIPNGCPIEIDPPLTFSFSGSIPSRSRQ